VTVSSDRSDERRSPAELVRGLLPRRSPRDLEVEPGAGPSIDVPRSPRHIDDVIGDCGVYEDGRRRPGRLSLDDARDVSLTTDGFVWIGLQQPTAEEFAVVAEAFHLPPLAVEDAITAHQRPKLETYGDIVFVVLKPVHYVNHEEVVDVSEIAFFLGPNFVVTVRHGQTDVLRQIRAEFDSGSSEGASYGPSGVLYRAADLVVDNYELAIAHINDDVDEIETQVFSADDDDHSERIYKLKREIAEFRRAVNPLIEPLDRLASTQVPLIDPATAPYFRDVLDHVRRSSDAIDGHDRLLSDVLQADLSRAAARHSRIAMRQTEIAVRQNEDLRKISAWAAIALVPTAIAGIYGMNFENMPELGWEYGYFIVIGIIAGACIGLHRLFRHNGWL
jgi:magnesium transporter